MEWATEMTEPEFDWPKDGDRLFAGAQAPERAIRLDQGLGCSRIEALGIGYYDAAERLVESALKDRGAAGRLAYPILFLYRQAIELSLKQVIALYGPQVGLAPIWSTHDLQALWNRHVEIAGRLGAMSDPADGVVADLLTEFSKADPGSYNFRYPVDTRGRPIAIVHPTVDLLALRDAMAGLWTYLWGSEEYFDHLVRQTKA